MKILLKYVVEETQKFVSICKCEESTKAGKVGGFYISKYFAFNYICRINFKFETISLLKKRNI